MKGVREKGYFCRAGRLYLPLPPVSLSSRGVANPSEPTSGQSQAESLGSGGQGLLGAALPPAEGPATLAHRRHRGLSPAALGGLPCSLLRREDTQSEAWEALGGVVKRTLRGRLYRTYVIHFIRVSLQLCIYRFWTLDERIGEHEETSSSLSTTSAKSTSVRCHRIETYDGQGGGVPRLG